MACRTSSAARTGRTSKDLDFERSEDWTDFERWTRTWTSSAARAWTSNVARTWTSNAKDLDFERRVDLYSSNASTASTDTGDTGSDYFEDMDFEDIKIGPSNDDDELEINNGGDNQYEGWGMSTDDDGLECWDDCDDDCDCDDWDDCDWDPDPDVIASTMALADIIAQTPEYLPEGPSDVRER